MKTLSIEGNIGVGKTTMIELLQKEFHNRANISVFAEPVHTWTPLLKLCYSEPSRWALTLDIRVMLENFHYQCGNSKQIVIKERSLDSCANIFLKNEHSENLICNEEYETGLKLYNTLSNVEGFRQINSYIYLTAPPEICYSRIKLRAQIQDERACENLLPLSYLSSLHTWIDNWLLNCNNTIVIDATSNIEQVYRECLSAIDKCIADKD